MTIFAINVLMAIVSSASIGYAFSGVLGPQRAIWLAVGIFGLIAIYVKND